MSCLRASKLISSHIDGSVDPEKAAWLHAHLQECPACQRELHTLRRLGELAASEGPAEPATGLTDRIMAGIPAAAGHAREDAPVDRWVQLAWPSAVAAVAAALVVTFVSLASDSKNVAVEDPIGAIAEAEPSAGLDPTDVLALAGR